MVHQKHMNIVCTCIGVHSLSTTALLQIFVFITRMAIASSNLMHVAYRQLARIFFM